MQAFAGMLAGDPTKAYQQSAGRQQALDTGNADVAAEKLLGLSLPGMFQSGVPGAMPMPGQMPQGQPGMQQQPMGAFGGGQPQQTAGGPLAGSQGPPMPGAPPPSAGMMSGAAAVTPGGGAPPQMGQQPLPMGGGMMGGQPPHGGLTLEKAVMALQQGAQRDPSLQDPRVFARALTKMAPLIQWQSREQMLAFREWAVGQQNLRAAAGLESRERNVDVQQQGATERTQAGIAGRAAEGEANRGSRERIAELGANTRQAIASMSAQTRKEIADQQATGRFEIAKLSWAARKEINEQNNDVKREIFAASEEGRMDRAFMGSEDRRAGIESREGIAGRQIESREGIAGRSEAGRQQRFDAGEAGKDRRAELSAGTRTAIASMNNEARRELQKYLESGRTMRSELGQSSRERMAQLSANTRAEIAKMSAEQRRELQEYLEGGRMERAEQGRTSREGIAERTEAGRETRSQRSQAGIQGRFETREQRLDRNALVSQDMQHQRLELQRKTLEDRIKQGGEKNLLSQWRAIVDAQNKRAREIITSSSPTGMDEKERKRLLADQDKFYRSQIETMKTGATGPVKVNTPDEATKLAPGTRYVTPDGQEYTR